jgi:hypothetical protein
MLGFFLISYIIVLVILLLYIAWQYDKTLDDISIPQTDLEKKTLLLKDRIMQKQYRLSID